VDLRCVWISAAVVSGSFDWVILCEVTLDDSWIAAISSFEIQDLGDFVKGSFLRDG
jgi:hypothetical protein